VIRDVTVAPGAILKLTGVPEIVKLGGGVTVSDRATVFVTPAPVALMTNAYLPVGTLVFANNAIEAVPEPGALNEAKVKLAVTLRLNR
jgi:hypothetical protein